VRAKSSSVREIFLNSRKWVLVSENLRKYTSPASSPPPRMALSIAQHLVRTQYFLRLRLLEKKKIIKQTLSFIAESVARNKLLQAPHACFGGLSAQLTWSRTILLLSQQLP
jgi:hypothetical protein